MKPGMVQIAYPTRTASHRQTPRVASPVGLSHTLRRILSAAPLALTLFFLAPTLHAQNSSDFGMTFTQQRSKFVGSSSSDFFYLRGATLDYSHDFWHGLGPVVSLNGLAVTNLRQQIDIHQASFLGGARYTYNVGHITPTVWNRRGSIFAEAQTGFVTATAGYYPSGNTLASNATNISYSFGGGINYNVYHDLELRLMAHYVVTDLPNGYTNQQRNIQGSLGVNWHFGN
jgi:hypothetical protein